MAASDLDVLAGFSSSGINGVLQGLCACCGVVDDGGVGAGGAGAGGAGGAGGAVGIIAVAAVVVILFSNYNAMVYP